MFQPYQSPGRGKELRTHCQTVNFVSILLTHKIKGNKIVKVETEHMKIKAQQSDMFTVALWKRQRGQEHHQLQQYVLFICCLPTECLKYFMNSVASLSKDGQTCLEWTVVSFVRTPLEQKVIQALPLIRIFHTLVFSTLSLETQETGFQQLSGFTW